MDRNAAGEIEILTLPVLLNLIRAVCAMKMAP